MHACIRQAGRQAGRQGALRLPENYPLQSQRMPTCIIIHIRSQLASLLLPVLLSLQDPQHLHPQQLCRHPRWWCLPSWAFPRPAKAVRTGPTSRHRVSGIVFVPLAGVAVALPLLDALGLQFPMCVATEPICAVHFAHCSAWQCWWFWHCTCLPLHPAGTMLLLWRT
jgi:hypothetical protein